MTVIIISGYFAIAILVALTCWFLLPSNIRTNNRNILWQFMTVAAFIPVFGIIAVFIGTVLSWFARRPDPDYKIGTLDYPPFLRRAVAIPHRLSVGSAYEVLFSPSADDHKKMNAAITVNSYGARYANKLNKQLLNSPNYNLRLYAFNAMLQQERVLERLISKRKRLLERTKDPLSEQRICKQLAFLYWEYIYNDLLHKGMASRVVSEVIKYAERAVKTGINSPYVSILLGRANLYLKNYKSAEKELLKVLNENVPSARVIPYLIELYYEIKDFRKLRFYLNLRDDTADIFAFSTIAAFWSGDV